MAETLRVTTLERDIEQAIVALKKGAYLLKYGRKGKPRFCPFRLSTDGRILLWYVGIEEFQLNLSSVSRIVPGQRTANFHRHPQPDKEYQSFSLIYGQDNQSLDLVCKDKEQAELWFIGLKALISDNGQLNRVRVDRKNETSLDTCSPVGHLHNKLTNAFQEYVDAHRPNSSPYFNNADKHLSATTISSVNSKRQYAENYKIGESLHCVDTELGADNALEGFRVSLSSVISSSSQGSAQDEGEALGDIYMWGEGIGCGILGGGMVDGEKDAFLPKHVESAVMLDVQHIACGSSHVALVNRQGEMFCWGEEQGGRLGHGMNTDISQPQIVETLALTSIEHVACSDNHTCAVTSTGDLYTWGNGSQCEGLLGHGNDLSHWVPRRVTLPETTRVVNVACGPWHTAFITTTGQLFTFGDGTFGALGHGDRKSSSQPRVVQSLKGLKVIRIACGPWHCAAVVEVILGYSSGSHCASGKLFTWGDGDKARLGHGNKESKLLPTCVAALVDCDFRQVACGYSLTVALTTSGQVYTMGSSNYGQLGDPLAKGDSPNLVEGKLWEAFVEEISCGSHHVAVLTSRGEVFTWGKGANGRLGLGDYQDRHSPTRVEALKGKQVKSVACGSSITAVICLHKLFTGADQTICSGCRMPFMFTRKRHNCYNCGQSFCHTCSSKKAVRAKLAPNPKKSYRVCDSCYVKVKVATESSSRNQMQACTGGMLATQALEIKRKDKSELKAIKGEPFTPKMALLEFTKALDGKATAKQSKRHESLRRVSPAPTDLVPWGTKAAMPPFISDHGLAINPEKPDEQQNIVATKPHSPHVTLSSLNLGFNSHNSKLNKLKETNRALSHEILKLHNQLETLQQRYHCQEEELQHAIKEVKLGRLLAGEEAAKCRAAKEVIKSLTLQLKDVAGNMSNRVDVQNRGEFDVSKLGTRQVTTPENVLGTPQSHHQMKTSDEIPCSNIQTSDETENNLGNTSSNVENREKEWVEQDDPGVFITFVYLANGKKDLKRVRFSRKSFTEAQAEQWWAENRYRVYERYSIPAHTDLFVGTSETSSVQETCIA